MARGALTARGYQGQTRDGRWDAALITLEKESSLCMTGTRKVACKAIF
jgi:hypothetical protein